MIFVINGVECNFLQLVRSYVINSVEYILYSVVRIFVINGVEYNFLQLVRMFVINSVSRSLYTVVQIFTVYSEVF